MRHRTCVAGLLLLLMMLVIPSFADDTSSARLPVRVREGFRVERVYQVPRETEGARERWRSLTGTNGTGVKLPWVIGRQGPGD